MTPYEYFVEQEIQSSSCAIDYKKNYIFIWIKTFGGLLNILAQLFCHGLALHQWKTTSSNTV